MPWLRFFLGWFSVLLVDQLDRSGPEIGVAAVGSGAFNSVPDHLGEVAGNRAAGAAGGEAGQMETHPADDVVDRVGAAAAQRVVDGKEQVRVQALLERVLDQAVVPLRAGVGEVRADGEVARVALEDPARERLAARAALASVDVEQVERAGGAGLAERKRRHVSGAEA